jgi:peptidoglycan hydrolase CwlO-like protein
VNDAEQNTVNQLNAEIASTDVLIANLRSTLEQSETELATLVAANEERASLVLHIEQGS